MYGLIDDRLIKQNTPVIYLIYQYAMILFNGNIKIANILIFCDN